MAAATNSGPGAVQEVILKRILFMGPTGAGKLLLFKTIGL
jgi:ATP-dependent protease Clp ATPase subunit